jgi:hypothetical protein
MPIFLRTSVCPLRGAADGDAQMQHQIMQLKSRVVELEAGAANAARALATANSEVEALQARLASAELEASRAVGDAHELQAAAAERDQLAARLHAVEARLEESRGQRAEVESYKALARQSEGRRARAEEELVTTARLATELEGRLLEVVREIEATKLEAQVGAYAH